MKLKFLMLIVSLLMAFNAHAELYKWVDENGKIHYSDKQPKASNKSEVIPIKNPSRKASQPPTNEKAIIRPYEKKSRNILLTDIIYRWRKQQNLPNVKKVGAYYLGKHCSPRGAIMMPDVYTHHGAFFPNESAIPVDIKLIIKSLGYDVEITTRYDLLQRIEKTNGLYLQAEIFDLQIHSCAPVYNPAGYVSPKQLPVHNYKKNRVNLKIKWQLKSDREEKLVFEKETSGYYDGWHTVKRPEASIRKAVEVATINLFADERFIAEIVEAEQKETGRAQLEAADQGKTGGTLLDKLLPYLPAGTENIISNTINNQYRLKAKLASVFAETTAIKVSLESYYFSHGKWPRSMEDIGLTDAMFVNHDLISGLDIQGDGTIVVELQNLFGDNRYIQLIPKTAAFNKYQPQRLKWQCYSNVDKAINPLDCDTN